MGFWKSERGINGDSWADTLDNCMESLSKIIVPAKNEDEENPEEAHEITMQELADLVEFCSRGHLVVEVRYPDEDGGRPLSELHNWGIETYPNRGRIRC